MTPRCLFAALLLVATVACESTPPPPPAEGTYSWRSYANESVGYVLEIPSTYVPHPAHGGKDVIFRQDGFPVLCVNFVTPEEGRSRGLWAKHEPAREAVLGGRRAAVIPYRHHDGPSFMQVLSFVAPHRGQELGLEFRTPNREPDALQQHILDSFRFTDS